MDGVSSGLRRLGYAVAVDEAGKRTSLILLGLAANGQSITRHHKGERFVGRLARSRKSTN